MTVRNVKDKRVHTKKKTPTTMSRTSKSTESKKPRKRSPAPKKKLTFQERAAQQGPLRSTLLLSAGVLLVCLYALFIEVDLRNLVEGYQGVLSVFFGFICFHFLLIYIGYQIGRRKTHRRKIRK